MNRKKVIVILFVALLLSQSVCAALVGPIVERIWYFKDWAQACEDVYTLLKEDLTNNILGMLTICHLPDGTRGVADYLSNLLYTVFALAILGAGAYFMFVSTDFEGRARAKSMLLKLIVGMLFVTFAFPLFELLLLVSCTLTESIEMSTGLTATNIGTAVDLSWTWLNDTIWKTKNLEPSAALPFLFMILTLLWGPIIMLTFRYIAMVFLAMIFPLTIFLYSFKPTKKIGELLIIQTILWIFFPVVEITVLAVVSFEVVQFGGFIGVLMSMAALFFLITAPMIMLGRMNWLAAMGITAAMFLEPIAALIAVLERIELEEPDEVGKI